MSLKATAEAFGTEPIEQDLASGPFGRCSKARSAPRVEVEAAPGVPRLAFAVLDVQVKAAQVADDVLKRGPLLRPLVPACLHEGGEALRHVWGHLWPIASDDLEEHLHTAAPDQSATCAQRTA